MIDDPLAQVLVLLAAAVVVVTLARRIGLPALLGYLAAGTIFGPYALGAIDSTGTTRLLAELGVVFLLFTLGLEFSWPRLVAMRREVFEYRRWGSVRCIEKHGEEGLATRETVGGDDIRSIVAVQVHGDEGVR